MLMIANFGFSQSNSRLQGPAAKNAKPWHKKNNKSKVVYTENNKKLQGPAAKNAKPWHKKDTSQVEVAIGSTNRHQLKGPKAKNFKPWTLSTLNEKDTITIKEKDDSKIN